MVRCPISPAVPAAPERAGRDDQAGTDTGGDLHEDHVGLVRRRRRAGARPGRRGSRRSRRAPGQPKRPAADLAGVHPDPAGEDRRRPDDVVADRGGQSEADGADVVAVPPGSRAGSSSRARRGPGRRRRRWSWASGCRSSASTAPARSPTATARWRCPKSTPATSPARGRCTVVPRRPLPATVSTGRPWRARARCWTRWPGRAGGAGDLGLGDLAVACPAAAARPGAGWRPAGTPSTPGGCSRRGATRHGGTVRQGAVAVKR